MNRVSLIAAFLFALAAGCGGGQDKAANPVASGGDDGETVDPATGEPIAASDAGVTEADAAAQSPAPAVTFEIHNTWKKDLVFNLDAGWGATILIYSGKPPHAKAVLPWAKHCTASCDAEPTERCPICEKPESITELRKSEKRQSVAPGDTFELPWDGQVHVYEKTRGKRSKTNKSRCECYGMAPVPDETYTVRACGLRLSQEHKKKSKFQCVTIEDALTFPSDGPQRVVLEFGDPMAKKKHKKRASR